MTWAIDRKLHWTDHYVEYGFAVIKRVVGDEFIKPALEEVRRLRNAADAPFNQWTAKPHSCHMPYDGKSMPVLASVYDQPGVRGVIDTMFASRDAWNGERAFQLFVSAYDVEAKQVVSPVGHLDFVHCPIPSVGSGFMFQVSLINSEPFSGNLSLYPGGHKKVQKYLIENPDAQYPEDPTIVSYMHGEPYEFVAEAGDMVLFHHLIGHNGNPNHAANRTPRIVIHGQGLLKEWPREVDPDRPRYGPWERSMATNGKHRTRKPELEWITEWRAEQAKLKKPKPAAAY